MALEEICIQILSEDLEELVAVGNVLDCLKDKGVA